MLQAFYTATVGAQQQMERMGVQGNNMANACLLYTSPSPRD